MPGFTEFRFLDGEEDCDAEFQSQGPGPVAQSKQLQLNGGATIPKALPEWMADNPQAPQWGTTPGQPASFGEQVVVKVQPRVGGQPSGAAKGYLVKRDGHPGDFKMVSLAILGPNSLVAYLEVEGQAPIEVSAEGPGAWGTPPYVFA